MKVCINNKRGKLRGASVFLKQLSSALDDLGCVITNKNPDITLCPVYGKNPHNSKTVYRIDGMYYDIKRKNMNKGIRNNVISGDGIVYQSNFSKNMIERMLGCKAKKSKVIHNGMDQSVFDGVKKDYSGERIFVAAAHWRPNKRPITIAKAFLEANIDNSRLIFIGKVDENDQVRNPCIEYVGDKNRKEIVDIYKKAHYMIHICHIDSCPNSVIEGLSAGLPVICNNTGGTPEIVKDSGIIANIEPAFDFNFINNMKKIPKPDRKELSNQIRRATEIKSPVLRKDLDIVNVAKMYNFFFDEVLS